MSATTPAPAWFYQSADRECGPVSPDELRAKALAGEIGPDTPVRREGRPWARAASMHFLAAALEEGRRGSGLRPPAVEQDQDDGDHRPDGNGAFSEFCKVSYNQLSPVG